MVDSKRFRDWLDKAGKDLEAARILKQHGSFNDTVAFHCQQAIEKALKGFVLYKTSELAEGHSLVYLCKKAATIDITFKTYLKDCAYVNQYYIETRYPADFPLEVSDEEALECLAIAARITDYISSTTQ